jgi:hypothetical protein
VPKRSDLVVGRRQLEFGQKQFVLDEDSVGIAREAHRLALDSGDLGRVAETGFGLAFTLLWADRVDDAVKEFARHRDLIRRIGDRTLLMRFTGYQAVAARRLRAIDDCLVMATEALEVARSLESGYYSGHALANLAWTAWVRGDTTGCRTLAAEAIERWGVEDGFLLTEFAWLAVWPLVAVDLERGDLDGARRAVGYLAAPHERPMGEPLASTVAGIIAQSAAEDDEALLIRARDEAVSLQLL